jgi:hypothetical protein
MTLGTYYRTASHTRWSQLLWRTRYTWERRRPPAGRWAWQGGAAPRVRDDLPDVPPGHRPRPRGAEAVALLRQGTFRHLNASRDVGRERPDWALGPCAADRLWTVTLHYHAWAYDLAEAAAAGGPGADEAAELFRHYLSDWMTRCALDVPGARDLAWNAYAVATRIGWWARAFRLLGGARFRAWGQFADDFLSCLWQQAAYLDDHLEWDLRANHLLRDAVGLAWAGRFFEGNRARRWLDAAARLAREQAAEQVLADGGHFERSPMYHLHVMEDVLTLALLVEDPETRARLRETWAAQAKWLAWLRHPDGDIPLFNDAVLHAACVPDEMLDLGKHLGVAADAVPRRGGRSFADTGLVVWHGRPWSVFFDVGPVGPDYQPGHAHADTLSLECSYLGRRLFVDPGTYAYDHDRRRRYDRSTSAHNTVAVDGHDSSEVWHIFRVGRRAYPRDVTASFGPEGMDASAAHTGYDHLPGRPRHARQVAVRDGGALVVDDHVGGAGDHRLEGGLLLAPDWEVSAAAGGWALRNGADRVRVTVRGPAGLRLAAERRPYHPEYGKEVETVRLTWRLEGPLPAAVTTVAEGV